MIREQSIRPARQSPEVHRWLLSVVFAALVIVGLLGMHTLSTAHASSPLAVVSAGAAAMDADHLHAQSAMEVASASACLDCDDGAHHAMIMACVLGLLVTLLLVCRATPGWFSTRRVSVAGYLVRPTVALASRPPSLMILSISRT